MSIAENVLNFASNTVEVVARKSTFYAQIAKQNVKLTAEKNGLKDLYAKLGEAYYQNADSGSDEFAKELCELIAEKLAAIDAIEVEIERLKAEDKAASEKKAEEAPEEEITIEVPEEPKAEEPEAAPAAEEAEAAPAAEEAPAEE